jgi:hypothetical protein
MKMSTREEEEERAVREFKEYVSGNEEFVREVFREVVRRGGFMTKGMKGTLMMVREGLVSMGYSIPFKIYRKDNDVKED